MAGLDADFARDLLWPISGDPIGVLGSSFLNGGGTYDSGTGAAAAA